MAKWIFVCIALFAGPLSVVRSAEAAMIATTGATAFSGSQRVHVIVVGAGNDLGDMFLKAAMGKLAKIKDAEPESKIVVYAEVAKNLEKESKILQNMGLQIVEANLENLSLSQILSLAVSEPGQIASLSFYTHLAIVYGIHLFKSGRYNFDDPSWDILKGHLARSAYMIFNGCNSGFYMAPALSERLEIPVAGTLTSIDFQYLNKAGDFSYVAPEGEVTFPEVDFNRKSFSKPVSCSMGACSRMQSYFRSYSGYWGDFKNGGFPGFKFFCRGVTESQCERTMALSLTHQVSNVPLKIHSSESEFRKALANVMCPQVKEKDLVASCTAKIKDFRLSQSRSFYSPFFDKTLRCDMHGCDFSFKCDNQPGVLRDGSCLLINPVSDPTDTFMEEIRHYLKGSNWPPRLLK